MSNAAAKSEMRATKGKLIADLSLDLDNKWSYLKTHGDAAWESLPSYLDIVIPHVIEILERHRLNITVFVVGQDAAVPANQASLRQLVDAGHEIGNHSFHHEPWLQRYTPAQLQEEFDRAEEALLAITSKRPVGFRGPGYSFSPEVLRQLARRGYTFDASTLPTFIGPLARAYYFLKSNLSREQAEDRQQLFGSIADGFRPIRPYRWRLDEMSMVEIPVSTMPVFRSPFHFSYVLYLALYSRQLAKLYFSLALRMCQLFRLGPSLLLHPLDFVGGDEVDQLDFFPAMKMPGAEKRALISELLGMYARRFDVRSMGERASILSKQRLRVRSVAEVVK